MRLLLGLIILGLGALVGWYILNGNTSINLPTPTRVTPRVTPTPEENLLRASGVPGFPEVTGVQMEGADKGGVLSRSVVTYTDTGFAPSPLTVKAGTTVTFVNESTGGMWVASAVHPSHTVLPGFDQKKSVVKGSTYEYTFSRVGTWRYHNHVKPETTGVVVVTE